MPKLPNVTADKAIAAFEKLGFEVARIHGSHHMMKRAGHPCVLSVPKHGRKPLKAGTLRSLIRDAGLDVEEFAKLLD